MNKHLILVLTMVMCYSLSSYAQESINMVEILNIEQDIISLEKRITKLTKKKSDLANMQELRQFHIFWLATENNKLTKESFLDSTFLYKLIPPGYYDLGPRLFPKIKKYLRSETLITDSVGNLVAKGDARFIHISPAFFQSDVEIAKMFFDKEIDFVFRIGPSIIMRYMVGVKGGNLFVFERIAEGLKIYPWKEFMECCFEEWLQ